VYMYIYIYTHTWRTIYQKRLFGSEHANGSRFLNTKARRHALLVSMRQP
jgi:hypothetical protein